MDAVRIRRNTLYAFAATAVRMLATMLMFVGIARAFGPEVFGQFTLAHTYLTIFYVLADFGIDVLLVTEIARRRVEAEHLVQRFVPLKIILSVVALGSMIGIGLLSGVGAETATLMVVLSLAIIGNSATTFVLGVLKGHEEFSFEAHTSFWQHAVLLLGLVILALVGADIVVVAGLFVVSRFAGFFVVLPRAWHHLRLMPVSFSLRGWQEGIREALPFGLHLLLGTLFFHLDTILLSMWEGEYGVGMYQSAMKLVMLALVLSDVSSNAIMPTLARLLHEDADRAVGMAKLFAKVLMFAGLPVAWSCFLFPREILALVYGGAEYEAATPVLKILALTVFLRFATDAYSMLLTASGRQARRAVISSVGTLVSLGLNMILIPRYGIEGAALASVLVHLTVGGLAIAFLGPQIRLRLFQRDIRKGLVVMILIAFAGGLWASGIDSAEFGLPVLILGSLVVSWFVGLSGRERKILAGAGLVARQPVS